MADVDDNDELSLTQIGLQLNYDSLGFRVGNIKFGKSLMVWDWRTRQAVVPTNRLQMYRRDTLLCVRVDNNISRMTRTPIQSPKDPKLSLANP